MSRFLFCCLACLFCCKKNPQTDLSNYSNTVFSTAFAAGLRTGIIQGNFVKELSGIAASRLNIGGYWVHSDGAIKEIYLIDSLGNHLATLPLSAATPTIDCEDIATGWLDGQAYIFLADIGDNNGQNDTHRIYRIPEPMMPNVPRPVALPVPTDMRVLTFGYPGGIRFNAESLLFDPMSKDILVVTKDATATVFVLQEADWAGAGTVTAQRVAELPISKATAGDISSDGLEVLLKNKQEIFYWKLPRDSSVRAVLGENLPERTLYSPETQGEAICFNIGNIGFLTSTERANANEQPIFSYKLK